MVNSFHKIINSLTSFKLITVHFVLRQFSSVVERNDFSMERMERNDFDLGVRLQIQFRSNEILCALQNDSCLQSVGNNLYI